jgi:hypothetical protein
MFLFEKVTLLDVIGARSAASGFFGFPSIESHNDVALNDLFDYLG